MRALMCVECITWRTWRREAQRGDDVWVWGARRMRIGATRQTHPNPHPPSSSPNPNPNPNLNRNLSATMQVRPGGRPEEGRAAVWQALLQPLLVRRVIPDVAPPGATPPPSGRGRRFALQPPCHDRYELVRTTRPPCARARASASPATASTATATPKSRGVAVSPRGVSLVGVHRGVPRHDCRARRDTIAERGVRGVD